MLSPMFEQKICGKCVQPQEKKMKKEKHFGSATEESAWETKQDTPNSMEINREKVEQFISIRNTHQGLHRGAFWKPLSTSTPTKKHSALETSWDTRKVENRVGWRNG